VQVAKEIGSKNKRPTEDLARGTCFASLCLLRIQGFPSLRDGSPWWREDALVAFKCAQAAVPVWKSIATAGLALQAQGAERSPRRLRRAGGVGHHIVDGGPVGGEVLGRDPCWTKRPYARTRKPTRLCRYESV